MSLKAEAWFPSIIWSGILDGVDNEKIKTHIHDVKSKDDGVKISNYGGWQSNAIQDGVPVPMLELMKEIDTNVKEIAKQIGYEDLTLYNVWYNVNGKGDYNEMHDHAGAILSGVYYVEADEGMGNIIFERSDNAQFFLPGTDNPNYFNSIRATYKSMTNVLYVFPAFLKHGVEGNRTDKERISISFNYGPKQ